MGLDATVYCNCFETGKLKELPPYIDLIRVADDGSLDCKSEDLELLLEFDQWLLRRACQHENGVLLHHRIGNIALIGLLRNELSRQAEKFPITLQKILYNGIHGGDYISLEDVKNLKNETDNFDGFVCFDKKNQEFVSDFRQQLKELINCSLQVEKPISF